MEYPNIMDPQKFPTKGNPIAIGVGHLLLLGLVQVVVLKKQKYHFFLTLSKIPAWRPA